MSDPIRSATPPKAGSSDKLHAFGKAALASIPGVGAAASELFVQCIAEPLEKKRQAFMEEVLERLVALEQQERLNTEELSKNDVFQAAFVQALRAADGTTEQEKRLALKHAVINCALGDLDATNQHMFIRLVEELTAAHLVLLRTLDHPGNALAATGGTLSVSLGAAFLRVLECVTPNLVADEELLDQLVRELLARGLVQNFDIRRILSEHGLLERRTSRRGRAFIDFITAPRES